MDIFYGPYFRLTRSSSNFYGYLLKFVLYHLQADMLENWFIFFKKSCFFFSCLTTSDTSFSTHRCTVHQPHFYPLFIVSSPPENHHHHPDITLLTPLSFILSPKYMHQMTILIECLILFLEDKEKGNEKKFPN